MGITQVSNFEIQKYLKKLRAYIQNDAKFSFLDAKLYEKKRIDDILCCIQASWPIEYKNYTAKYGSGRFKSPKYYQDLIKAVKNRFLFSTTCYSVDYIRAIEAIKQLHDSIDLDMRIILDEQENKF